MAARGDWVASQLEERLRQAKLAVQNASCFGENTAPTNCESCITDMIRDAFAQTPDWRIMQSVDDK